MKKLYLTVIGIFLVVLIVVTGFYFVGSDTFNPPQKYETQNLADGWTIFHDGVETTDRNLYDIDIGSIRRGEKFVLKRRLDGPKIPGACVYLRGLQSMIHAYVDDELVFKQGEDAYYSGRMPGRTLCYIPIPVDYVGKMLRIDITAGEPDAFTDIGPIYLGNSQDLFHGFVSDRQLPHLFGTFLTLFAMFEFLCATYLVFQNRNLLRQLFGALLVLCVGTYMLAFYNIFNMYISNQEVNTYLEFLSIYGIPMAICGYLQYAIEGHTATVYRNLTVLDIVLLIIVNMLHFTNVIHLSRLLMPMYMLCFLEIIPFAIYLIKRIKKHPKRIVSDRMEDAADHLPIYGMLLFAGCGFLDMGMFLYSKHIMHQELEATIVFTIIGGMILALSQMVSFLLQGVCYLRTEATRMHLKNIAYTDPLTGLANRTSCERRMNELGKTRGQYVMISMDLDFLKQVNDEYGHMRGDEMIKTFASVLRDKFTLTETHTAQNDSGVRPNDEISGEAEGEPTGFGELYKISIGRMGGDEFLVIMRDSTKSEASEILASLRRRLNLLNDADSDLTYSVSYGMAASTEVRPGTHPYEVYMLADQRMYEMKYARHRELRERAERDARSRVDKTDHVHTEDYPEGTPSSSVNKADYRHTEEYPNGTPKSGVIKSDYRHTEEHPNGPGEIRWGEQDE